MPTVADTRPDLDLATIAAIGMLAYLIANVTHEGLGHGGACLLVGGRPLAISSAWFDGDESGVSAQGVRFVKAAGTLANLVLGILLLPLLRRLPRRSGHLYAFVWLTMIVNLFVGGGYLLVSPLGGVGDWREFVAGLDHPGFWRLGLTVIGAGLYSATLWLGIWTIDPLLGSSRRSARARRLCFIPYFAIGGFVFTLAAAFNPYGPQFMLSSALAHLGGTAWLLWLPSWVAKPRPGATAEPLPLSRHTGWLLAGALALVICVGVLGPGVRFDF